MNAGAKEIIIMKWYAINCRQYSENGVKRLSSSMVSSTMTQTTIINPGEPKKDKGS
jgi:hypothetical protein